MYLLCCSASPPSVSRDLRLSALPPLFLGLTTLLLSSLDTRRLQQKPRRRVETTAGSRKCLPLPTPGLPPLSESPPFNQPELCVPPGQPPSDAVSFFDAGPALLRRLDAQRREAAARRIDMVLDAAAGGPTVIPLQRSSLSLVPPEDPGQAAAEAGPADGQPAAKRSCRKPKAKDVSTQRKAGTGLRRSLCSAKRTTAARGSKEIRLPGPCCFFVDLKLQLQRRATVPPLHILTTTSSFTGTRQALPGSSFKCIWRMCSLYYKTPAAVLQHILQDHAAVLSFSNGPVCRRRGPWRTRRRGTRRNVSGKGYFVFSATRPR